MLIYSRNIDRVQEPLLKIGEKRVQSVSNYEYLGIIMDDRLNMDNHIEHSTKKVQAKLSILQKIRRHISEESALLIFKTMILCHFDYGDFVVDSGTVKKKTGNLDRLYIGSLRCIEYGLDKNSRLNIDKLYHRYNVEPLKNRRSRNLLKIMYTESKVACNIDMYRPEQILRSVKNVKLKYIGSLNQPKYNEVHIIGDLSCGISCQRNCKTLIPKLN